MACNPCCCWNIRDGVVTIGIWATTLHEIDKQHEIDGIVMPMWLKAVDRKRNKYLLLSRSFGDILNHKMAAIKYEKDRAANMLLPNYYEYGRFDVPSYYENFWQGPEERFYTGLFVIQILCLISSFFLLFASVALMYGAHTYSRYLIWPWFPCMIASILTSLAYCIMWWTGDVRSYWLIITILEVIAVMINLYCLTAVLMFYRQIESDKEYYERKQRVDSYGQYPERYDEYRKDQYYSQNDRVADLNNYSMPPMYQKSSLTPSPPLEEYRPLPEYSQEPAPAIRPKSPYRDLVAYPDDDLVSSWVRDQQTIGLIPDHANSEPTTPVEQQHAMFGGPLQHSLSVPSMYAETSGATSCRHHHCHKPRRRHRSSSRHRYDDEDEHFRRDSARRHSRRRRRSSSPESRSRRSYSSDSYATQYTEEARRHRRRSRSSERFSDESSPFSEDSSRRRRHRRREHRDRDSDRERKRGPRQVKREDKDREPKRYGAVTAMVPPQTSSGVVNGQWQGQGTVPGSQGGITIPQHIIIPPSNGTIGPDGRVQPQSYQINSEIRISYDQFGRPLPQGTGAPNGAQPHQSVQYTPSSAGIPVAAPVRRGQTLSAAHLEGDHSQRRRKPTAL